MMNNLMTANFGAEKFMSRMFRRVEGVTWDLMSGRVGIKTPDGSIATLSGSGEDAQVEINLVDQFGIEIPAFAQNTPIESVAVGDVIYFGANEKPGWVIEVGPKFTLMKVDGQRTTWKPPKVSILGMGDNGVMVLRSLMNMLPGGNAGLQSMQGMLMPMLMMGGDGVLDLEKLMPLMLMGQMQAVPTTNADGTTVAAPNPMAQMLPMLMMMQLMKGEGSKPKKSPNNNPFTI